MWLTRCYPLTSNDYRLPRWLCPFLKWIQNINQLFNLIYLILIIFLFMLIVQQCNSHCITVRIFKKLIILQAFMCHVWYAIYNNFNYKKIWQKFIFLSKVHFISRSKNAQINQFKFTQKSNNSLSFLESVFM